MRHAGDMRDVYTRRAPQDDLSSPACLRTMAPRAPPPRAASGPPPLRPLPAVRRPAGAARAPVDEPACELAAEAGEEAPPALRLSGSAGAGAGAGSTVRGHEELPSRERCAAEAPGSPNRGARAYCTLPRRRAGVAAALFRSAALPPRRTTPDGTDIYYWCDLPKHPPHGRPPPAIKR